MNNLYFCSRCGDDFNIENFNTKHGICNDCKRHREYFQNRPPRIYDKGLFRFHGGATRQSANSIGALGFLHTNKSTGNYTIFVYAEKIFKVYPFDYESIINYAIMHETLHMVLSKINEGVASGLIDTFHMRTLLDEYLTDLKGIIIECPKNTKMDVFIEECKRVFGNNWMQIMKKELSKMGQGGK